MQATQTQKAHILQALYMYARGQLCAATAAAAYEDAQEDVVCRGHVKDAQSAIAIAVAFAQHCNMQQMLQHVNMLDTLVYEDIFETLKDYESTYAVLQTLQ